MHELHTSNGHDFVFDELPYEDQSSKKEIDLKGLPLEDIARAVSEHQDFFYIIDSEHRFTFVNKALLNLWGKTRDEAIGKTFAELGYPIELQELHEKQLALAFSGKAVRGENAFYDEKNKKEKYHEHLFYPIKEDSANINAVAVITREITHRKLADDDREYLVNAIAHDLRSPLAVIQSTAELISELDGDPEESAEGANRISKQVARMDQMILDVLDATKLKTGEKLNITGEKSNIYNIVSNVVDELKLAHGERFYIELNPDKYEAYHGVWDPMSVRRITYNLVGNAIKYGDPFAPIKIVLNAQGKDITLEVNNQGEPIKENTLKRIKAMLDGQNVQKVKSKKGWGIGMSIIKGLVEAYNGSVKVESNQTDGTTFCVTLPQFKKPS